MDIWKLKFYTISSANLCKFTSTSVKMCIAVYGEADQFVIKFIVETIILSFLLGTK